ncbi:MAG: TM2 domain-containing protein [Erysipelotrichaceae bacterium]
MNSDKIDFFLMSSAKYFPPEKLYDIKARMELIDDSQSMMLLSQQYKDPTTTLILSVVLGAWGVDRFMLDDTAMGILKLLTGGLCGILTIIDWFSATKRTQEYNYKRFINTTMMFRKSDSNDSTYNATPIIPIISGSETIAVSEPLNTIADSDVTQNTFESNLNSSTVKVPFLKNPKFGLIGALVSFALIVVFSISQSFLNSDPLEIFEALLSVLQGIAYFASVVLATYALGLILIKKMDKILSLVLTGLGGVVLLLFIIYFSNLLINIFYNIRQGGEPYYWNPDFFALIKYYFYPFTLFSRFADSLYAMTNNYGSTLYKMGYFFRGLLYTVVTPYVGIGLPIGILALQKNKDKINKY